jgi:hypothetical protein
MTHSSQIFGPNWLCFYRYTCTHTPFMHDGVGFMIILFFLYFYIHMMTRSSQIWWSSSSCSFFQFLYIHTCDDSYITNLWIKLILFLWIYMYTYTYGPDIHERRRQIHDHPILFWFLYIHTCDESYITNLWIKLIVFLQTCMYTYTCGPNIHEWQGQIHDHPIFFVFVHTHMWRLLHHEFFLVFYIHMIARDDPWCIYKYTYTYIYCTYTYIHTHTFLQSQPCHLTADGEKRIHTYTYTYIHTHTFL